MILSGDMERCLIITAEFLIESLLQDAIQVWEWVQGQHALTDLIASQSPEKLEGDRLVPAVLAEVGLVGHLIHHDVVVVDALAHLLRPLVERQVVLRLMLGGLQVSCQGVKDVIGRLILVIEVDLAANLQDPLERESEA